MKKCSKCKIEKELSEFKRYSVCIDCNKILNKEYNDSRKEKMREYYINNRELFIKKSRENYSKNKDYITIRNKKYQEENRENRNNYINNRKKSDNLFKLSISIRKLIWISINKMGYKKNSKTNLILGCSFEEFKIHIESQFKDGMSWENYGEWHLDHKTPVSWAETEEQIYELNNYTNFQPLWAKDNLSKGNKWAD